MTIPNGADAPLLRTDADVLQRVRQLVGPAVTDRQLWTLFIDGDDRQAPAIMPISDIPARPDHEMISGLAAVLGGFCGELSTEAGSGCVVFALERVGGDTVRAHDREWARALTDACDEAGAALRGVYLSTSNGVQRIMPP